MIDAQTRAEWRKKASDPFMQSSLSEYCPPEFLELLDAYEELIGGENYPEEPQVKRQIATDAERLPCPSCEAQNVFLTHTVRNLDARRHVECNICGMHGPVKTSDQEALAAWNALPRLTPVAETCPHTGLRCIPGCTRNPCAGFNIPLNQWPVS